MISLTLKLRMFRVTRSCANMCSAWVLANFWSHPQKPSDKQIDEINMRNLFFHATIEHGRPMQTISIVSIFTRPLLSQSKKTIHSNVVAHTRVFRGRSKMYVNIYHLCCTSDILWLSLFDVFSTMIILF